LCLVNEEDEAGEKNYTEENIQNTEENGKEFED